MTSRQYTYREMDAATKEQNVWAKFTTAELQTKLSELLKLVDSVRRQANWVIGPFGITEDLAPDF